MLTRSELYTTREYWIEKIQNDIFRALHDYKVKNGLRNDTALAQDLGVSKGYISQIMNGNFNFSISKMVDLALTIGVAPKLEFQKMIDYISNEEVRLEKLSEPKTKVSWLFDNQTTMTLEDTHILLNLNEEPNSASENIYQSTKQYG